LQHHLLNPRLLSLKEDGIDKIFWNRDHVFQSLFLSIEANRVRVMPGKTFSLVPRQILATLPK
jgi:hypothetical protein